MTKIISALQHMYTSSRYSGGGFQTIACSQGLTREIINSLEQLITYPIDLGLRLSKKESPPEIYRYLKINGNRSVCAKSIFVPKDFAGRPGNYFSHSLVFNANELENPLLIFKTPETFEVKYDYDKETSTLPPKVVELKENTEIFSQYLPDEILNQLSTILEAIINTFKKQSSVFVILEQPEYIFPILSNIFSLLPPWLRADMTFTTLTLNPVRDAANYRIMFSLSKYNPQIPLSDSSNIVTFDFVNKNIPQIDTVSAWVKLINSYLKNNEREKAIKLISLHKLYGKENPTEMADILAKLIEAEDDFHKGQDLACLSILNLIFSLKNSKVKTELLQNSIEQFSKILLKKEKFDVYIEFLYLLREQSEIEIQNILKKQLEEFINNPSLSLLICDPLKGPKLLARLISFAQITEVVKKFVFESVSVLIENNPDIITKTFNRRFSPLQKEFDTSTNQILEELFLHLLSKFKEHTDIISYILEIFAETGIPSRKIDAVLDILNPLNLKIETFIECIRSFIEIINETKRTEVIEKTIRWFVDNGIVNFAPLVMSNLLALFSWKDCETIQKNLEKFYDKGRKLQSHPNKTFLFYRKQHQRIQTNNEIAYNESINTLKEIIWIKRKRK